MYNILVVDFPQHLAIIIIIEVCNSHPLSTQEKMLLQEEE